MSILIQWLLSALVIMAGAYILPGVSVSSFLTAIAVAAGLAIVNAIVKPLFVILTFPITIVTFGLFLLVINALMIMLVGAFVPGFEVSGFWSAVLYSLILSLINYGIASWRK